MDRNPWSPSIGIGGHDESESAVTFDRNVRSSCFGIRTRKPEDPFLRPFAVGARAFIEPPWPRVVHITYVSGPWWFTKTPDLIPFHGVLVLVLDSVSYQTTPDH